jgi:DNA uptake protein ComE-like DNA-binding protein
MGIREALGRCGRAARAGVGEARARLGRGGRALAERLAYRPREVLVIALLGAGVLGGLGVERWRRAHPELAERLEAEPARPAGAAASAAAPAPRRRRGTPERCGAGGRAGVGPSAREVAAVPGRLDLNRASAAELVRLAGIPWRTAARLVAARAALDADAGAGPGTAAPDLGRRRQAAPLEDTRGSLASGDREPAAAGTGGRTGPDP